MTVKRPTSITDIHEQAKQSKTMTAAANMAVKQFEEALGRIAHLEAENRHLKDLLTRTHKNLLVNPIETKAEELVADYEIKRLKDAAQARPLSLEEAKIFQIMTNAKKVIREVEDKESERAKDVTYSVPVQDLLELAKGDTE